MDMTLQPEALGALFELSRDAVLGIDEDRRVAFANPAAAALLGAEAGMPAEGLVPDYVLDDPAERFISSLELKDGRKASLAVTRQGGLTLISYTLQSGAAASVPYYLPEKALQNWGSSLMNSRMALDGLNSHTKEHADDATNEYFSVLYRSYYLMKRTCSHMASAASIAGSGLPFSPRAVDLKALCEDLCSSVSHFTEDRNITVTFRADKGPHVTSADRELLETMLLNLLCNSLERTAPGGAITVELLRQGKRFILSIRDPGSGISAEKLSALFSTGGTADLREPGAGLGFLIARSIVERHDGAIILESRPGHGTAIRISIPYREGSASDLHAPEGPDYRQDGMDRILTELAPVLDKRYYNKRMFD